MISAWLKARTQEFTALADAAERLASRPKVTLELRTSAPVSAEALRRNTVEMNDLVTELRKRL